MQTVLNLQDYEIKLGAIRTWPTYAPPMLAALGMVYLNWGRLEQTLEFLLHFLNDPRFVTGKMPKVPDTSFRLKTALFKKIYTKHPHFAPFHKMVRPICAGLKKANQSRVRMVHSNFQGFEKGPPITMAVTIAKFARYDLQTFHGTWTLEAITDFNELLCHLNEDLAKIASVTMTEEFRQSLERPLSRTQRCFLWLHRLLTRRWLPRKRTP